VSPEAVVIDPATGAYAARIAWLDGRNVDDPPGQEIRKK
jgi:hypothetical protein